MKRIFDRPLLQQYFLKYKIEELFDSEIIKDAQLQFFEKEELVLKAETQLEYYYLLVEGKIKISYLFENGKSMLLKFYSPFNTIGDIELFKNKPIRCSVEAIEDTYFIAIPATILRERYRNNLNFLHHLVDSLSEKLDATINNSSYNYVYPLVNRLASYLSEHMDSQNPIQLNSTYKELAQFLGTTYRHLSRTFHELEAEKILRCEKKTVYVLDEKRLQELSKNGYMKSI